MRVLSYRPYNGGLHVGASPSDKTGTPILAEPVVVTHGDLIQYKDIIFDLNQCLDKDSRANLIYMSPGKLKADAKNLVTDAAELDGCKDYYFKCPESGSGDFNPDHIEADRLRKEAALKFWAYDEVNKILARRGIKNDAAGNAQINAEILFYEEFSDFRKRFFALSTEMIESKWASGSDWKKVQAADLEYQMFRERYKKLGFEPTCVMPSFPAKSFFPAGLTIGLGIGLLAVAGIALFMFTRGSSPVIISTAPTPVTV